MSILAIVIAQDSIETPLRMAYQLASVRETPLYIIIAEHGDQCTDPETVTQQNREQWIERIPHIKDTYEQLKEIRNQYSQKNDKEDEDEPVEVIVKALIHSDRIHPILQEIKTNRTGVLIMPKYRSGKEHRSKASLAHSILQRAPCHTLLIRADASFNPEQCRILVPTSGGPHSRVALKLASNLCEDNQGVMTPLYVAPTEDEDSAEAFLRLLKQQLKRAKVAESEQVKPRVIAARNINQGIAEALQGEYDLMLIGESNSTQLRRRLFGSITDRAVAQKSNLSTAVVKAGHPFMGRILERIEQWLDLKIPQMTRDDRIQLFETLAPGSNWNFDFMTLIGLSTAIAALGLLQNSPAVVIGAMLVAPLMTPLLGSALALVQGNQRMILECMKAVIFGFGTALSISLTIGFIMPLPALTGELQARGGPHILDMLVAFLSGMAAAYCISRPKLSAALAGVAISAALVPPIAAIGISLALGETSNALGATLLFATNVVAIILGAAVCFYGGGIRGNKSQAKDLLWVRRTLASLCILMGIFAVPLSLVFTAKFVFTTQEQQPSVSENLRQKLEAIIQAEDGGSLTAIQVEEAEQNINVHLTIAAEQPPSDTLTQKLAQHLRETYERPITLSLNFEWQKSIHTP